MFGSDRTAGSSVEVGVFDQIRDDGDETVAAGATSVDRVQRDGSRALRCVIVFWQATACGVVGSRRGSGLARRLGQSFARRWREAAEAVRRATGAVGREP